MQPRAKSAAVAQRSAQQSNGQIRKVASAAAPRMMAPPTPAPVRPAPPRASAPLTPGVALASSSADSAALEYGGSGAPLPPKRPPPLRQQIEACFSNDGLRQDALLREQIAESPGGWIDLEAILSLKRVRALHAKREDVVQALRDSWLEIWLDPESSAAAVRRPPDKGPLPSLASPVPRANTSANKALAKNTTPVMHTRTDHGGHKASRSQTAGAGSLAGQTSSTAVLFPGRLRGEISSYDEESGDACISCGQVEVLFGRQVTVDWRELEQTGVAVSIGSSVSFRVELGAAGEPRAKELQLHADDTNDDDSEERPSKRSRNTDESGKNVAVVGNRYSGTLKAFHAKIGVGLISCPELRTIFGRDVAVTAAELAGFQAGDAVSFVLAMDPELGTPQAERLEAGVRVGQGAVAALRSKVQGPVQGARKAGDVARSNSTVQRRMGVFGPKGKVKCSGPGGRELCLSVEEASLSGFREGDKVSFVAKANPETGELMATLLRKAARG
eukprot:TRINITY_DN20793_c0_g1_i1.p1 TRINITY_DN20793_c0_g1~~TRINITY_DN20793_c0_g1_i1.p1  ORF type:complete len:502 (+),score=91.15 TRINITY_DN20793_c0_g1_i1:89-1594(+)